jgi:hypothetical protein
MKKISFLTLKKLKPIWIDLLKRPLPSRFYGKERIVRIIYSENNINPRNKNLKSNFFKHREGLSCMRLEFTDYNFCKNWAKKYEDIAKNRKYFGIACTCPNYIYLHNNHWYITYTPILEKSRKNLFHSDIINRMYSLEDYTSAEAEFNLLIEDIKRGWLVNVDDYLDEKEWKNGAINFPSKIG